MLAPDVLTGSRLRKAAMAERAKRELARRRIIDYVQYTMPPRYDKAGELYDPGYAVNWHHRLICDRLDAVVRGDCRRLMIFTPPRQGKSELVSVRLPGYAMGRDPSTRVIFASYGADLAQDMSRKAQRVLDSDEYSAVFPHVSLNKKNIRTLSGSPLRNVDEWEVIDPVTGLRHGGGYKCAGVGGALTGRGFDLGIIDDPVKGREEADSETWRDKVWDWYTSVFYTRRMGPQARIVIILTRWHMDDLAGRLLQSMRDGTGEQWETVYLPALAYDMDHERRHPLDPRQPGEPLWPGPPYNYGLEFMEQTRSQVGTRDWSALYQQEPAPGEGAVYLREWFRYWHHEEQFAANGDGSRVEIESLFRFATVDLAVSEKASADYTAILVWGYDSARKRLYLLDLERRQISAPDTLSLLRALRERHRLQQIWIERTAYQLALVQFARQQDLPVRELVADRDKVARAHGVTPWIEANGVYLPDGHRLLPDLESELFAFPLGAHDDMADALAYGVAVARDQLSQPAMAPSFPLANHRRLAWHRD